MSERRRKDQDVETQVMVDNRHTCCVCCTPNLHIQIHHIDGNRANTVAANLAVVCLQDHSRVTGDEGLGRRYTQHEVIEYKRRWESACALVAQTQAARIQIEQSLETQNEGRPIGKEDLNPLYSNLELARNEGAAVGVEITGNFASFMIDRLLKGLERAGTLSNTRPAIRADYAPKTLIHERVLATKVIVPYRTLKETVPGVRELAVWVADPDIETLRMRSDDRYDFTGTFLYLVTPLYDDNELGTFYSGCSALQVISNLINGESFFAVDWREPLARRSYAHPIDKLVSIGGVVVDRRAIETLYKPRYMTDEQCFADEKRAYRTHDLLAYPLFISNSFEAMLKRIRSTRSSDPTAPSPDTPGAPSQSGSST